MKKIFVLTTLLYLFACTKKSSSPTETIPSTPSNLIGTLISNSQIDLNWTDNSTNEAGFKIERKTGTNGTWELISTTRANVTNYSNTGLAINTTYFYRVYSFNSAGNSPSYSNEVNITTTAVPFITTTSISSTGFTTAAGGGNVTGDGGSPVSSRGICWSTNPNPTTALTTKTIDGNGTGTFTSSISNLSPSTTYYVRAYAINTSGIGYGNELSFTTQSPTVPVLSTTPISQILTGSANSGGTITSDGGASITKRGVVFSTSPTPILSTGTQTNNGSGTGTYTSSVTNLNPSTTYYLRAYAQNSIGIGYGNEISFTTASATVITAAGGATAGSGANQFSGIGQIFVDANDNLYVADWGNNRVQKWASGATSGVTVAGGNGQGSAANQLSTPNGVTLDAAGNIYVADWGNDRIQKWAPGATYGVTVAGGNGTGSAGNQLNRPWQVFLDAQNNIYIWDGANDRVQKWAPNSTSGTTVISRANLSYACGCINGLYVDAPGNIYVCEGLAIEKFASGSSVGTLIAGGNTSGSAANQMSNAGSGMFVDANLNLFFSDRGNYRVQKWPNAATSGITVAGGNGQGSSAVQLNGPGTVFVKGNKLYVADASNNRIQVWNL